MSPVRSFGTNEYGWPHFVQNPSVRPGRSPRARPTGAPQSEREQNRFRSGTSGFSWTIARGSGRGTSGTWTRPTPRRPRPDDAAEAPELRTDTDRDVDCPDRERDRRPETDRRDCEDRDEERELARDERELLRPLALLEPRPPTVMPVGGDATMPVGETTGARPQVSQYSSPPPTSSYDPAHPGRWHCRCSLMIPPPVGGTALIGHPRDQYVGGRPLVPQDRVLGRPQVAGRAPQHPPGRVVTLHEQRVLGEPEPRHLRLVRVQAAAQLGADRQGLCDRRQRLTGPQEFVLGPRLQRLEKR